MLTGLSNHPSHFSCQPGGLDLNQSQFETSRSSLDSPNFTGGSSKFSRIAAPLTSMLKFLSTESGEPRKDVVRVGGGGRNKAEPFGKNEVDGNDGGRHTGDFDMTF